MAVGTKVGVADGTGVAMGAAVGDAVGVSVGVPVTDAREARLPTSPSCSQRRGSPWALP